MRSIKHALTERWYAWEDARKLAESDPEIDLDNVQSPFTPKDYLEPESTPEHALEGAEQNNQTGQAPAAFMAEEPAPAKPNNIDPSAIPSQPTETQQPSAKP